MISDWFAWLTRSRQKINSHASKRIWLSNHVPPHQRFEGLSGDGRCIQILFEFVRGCIHPEIIQSIKQIISWRTLKLILDQQNALAAKYRINVLQWKTARICLILSYWRACNMIPTAPGWQCVLHQPMPQATSSTGSTTICISDGELKRNKCYVKNQHAIALKCLDLLMAHRYMTDSSVFA